MLRIFFTVFILGLVFGLDSHWGLYNEHQISLNKVIIKINDNIAPKLGLEDPLSINDINLEGFDNYNNFNTLKPLFRNYNSFNSNHYKYDLHQYYILSFIEPENNVLTVANKLQLLNFIDKVEFNYNDISVELFNVEVSHIDSAIISN